MAEQSVFVNMQRKMQIETAELATNIWISVTFIRRPLMTQSSVTSLLDASWRSVDCSCCCCVKPRAKHSPTPCTNKHRTWTSDSLQCQTELPPSAKVFCFMKREKRILCLDSVTLIMFGSRVYDCVLCLDYKGLCFMSGL